MFAEQTGHRSTVNSPFTAVPGSTEAQGMDTWHFSVVQQVES